jgi:hypothetical protein
VSAPDVSVEYIERTPVVTSRSQLAAQYGASF